MKVSLRLFHIRMEGSIGYGELKRSPRPSNTTARPTTGSSNRRTSISRFSCMLVARRNQPGNDDQGRVVPSNSLRRDLRSVVVRPLAKTNSGRLILNN